MRLYSTAIAELRVGIGYAWSKVFYQVFRGGTWVVKYGFMAVLSERFYYSGDTVADVPDCLGEIRPRPGTWEELVAVAALMDKYVGFGFRSVKGVEAYRRYIKGLHETGIALEEPILEQMGESDWLLVKNKFPYDRLMDEVNWDLAWEDCEVGHYCLWNKNGKDWDFEEVVRVIEESLSGVIKFCAFEHSIGNRSIKGLRHLHVFVMMALERGGAAGFTEVKLLG